MNCISCSICKRAYINSGYFVAVVNRIYKAVVGRRIWLKPHCPLDGWSAYGSGWLQSKLRVQINRNAVSLQLVERPIARWTVRDNRVYVIFYVYECRKKWRESYGQNLWLIRCRLTLACVLNTLNGWVIFMYIH